MDPDEELFNKGISFLKNEKTEEAIDIFSELVEKDDKNHKAWNAFGVALSQTAHKDSAIHCFENALSLDPENTVYKRNLIRAKSPPTIRKNPKMMELTEQKRPGRIIRALLISLTCLVTVGLLAFALLSGFVPGFSVQDGMIQGISGVPNPPVIEVTPLVTETPIPQVTIPSPIATPIPVPTQKPEVLFHFIDVSQGDATLIQSDGKNVLIDAGPSTSGPRLVDYLKKQNISTLDMVIASHPFDDHIGGMIDVLQTFEVKTYIDNGEPYNSDLYRKVIELVISDQAVRSIVKAGMKIPFTSMAGIDIISPYTLTGHPDEDSLVLKITVQNVTVLMPGDASDVKTPATILKVPDHGSDDAIASISNVRPEAVVISVGSGNPYDYPRSGTMNAIDKQGSQIFRTDVNGTIVIAVDGNNWTAKSSR